MTAAEEIVRLLLNTERVSVTDLRGSGVELVVRYRGFQKGPPNLFDDAQYHLSMATSNDFDPDTVFQILQDLDAVTFAHVVADICAARGWKPQVTVADSNYIADVVASRSLPFPESVSLIRYDDGELTKDRLERLLNRGTHDPVSRLSVVVHNPPSKDAVQLARTRNVGIVGLSDIAESIVMLSLDDLLKTHIEDDDSLSERYSDLLEQSETDRGQDAIEPDEIDSVGRAQEEAENASHRASAVSQEFQDAGFAIIEREVEAVFGKIRNDLEELRDHAVNNSEELTASGEFEPIISIVEGGFNRIEGIVLMSGMSSVCVEQVSEVGENGVERIHELIETYEAGDLRSQRGQTTEQTLFEKILETVGAMESSTLDIVEDTIDG